MSTMNQVTDVDRGYEALKDALSELLDTRGVYVGVRAESGSDLVIIAASNEFGTSDGHVPERSYLRSTVDAGRAEIGDDLVAAIDGALKGGDLDTGLGRVGAKWVGKVQQTIRDCDTPPNAPSTIARKGADNPLIDTGRLRQSIDWEIR